jgi:hypothetical protein
MSVPGFTAEATLYRMCDQHYVGSGSAAATQAQGIVPQNIECDIYIFCQDGIRYLKRDCPDGSGDTTRIGTCPRPLWWLFIARSIFHHFPG